MELIQCHFDGIIGITTIKSPQLKNKHSGKLFVKDRMPKILVDIPLTREHIFYKFVHSSVWLVNISYKNIINSFLYSKNQSAQKNNLV